MRVGTVAVFGSRSKISLLFSFSDRCAHGKRWNNANEIALDRNESPRKRKLIARIVARPSSFAVKRNFGPSPDRRNVRIDESVSIVSATTVDTYLHTVTRRVRSHESGRHAVSIRLNVEPALRDRPEQRYRLTRDCVIFYYHPPATATRYRWLTVAPLQSSIRLRRIRVNPLSRQPFLLPPSLPLLLLLILIRILLLVTDADDDERVRRGDQTIFQTKGTSNSSYTTRPIEIASAFLFRMSFE